MGCTTYLTVRKRRSPLRSNDDPGPSNSNQETPATSDWNDKFDDLGTLTQFIGKAPGESSANNENPTMSRITLLAAEFKEECSELIENLERANVHLDSLKAAKLKGRTPLKLRITIKPMVIEKERTEFQKAWKQATKSARISFLTCSLCTLRT